MKRFGDILRVVASSPHGLGCLPCYYISCGDTEIVQKLFFDFRMPVVAICAHIKKNNKRKFQYIGNTSIRGMSMGRYFLSFYRTFEMEACQVYLYE